jgi:hypothetical protein
LYFYVYFCVYVYVHFYVYVYVDWYTDCYLHCYVDVAPSTKRAPKEKQTLLEAQTKHRKRSRLVW